MEYKNGTAHIPLDVAKIMYKTDNEELKKLALEAYNEKELIDNFRQILSFADACDALDIHYSNALKILEEMEIASMVSSAMFKLNIIRKSLNMRNKLTLTKKSYMHSGEMMHMYYPYIAIVPKDCKNFDNMIKEDEVEVIGKIKADGEGFSVIGGYSNASDYDKLCNFSYDIKIGYNDANTAFLGCATEEIANYFSSRFGMLIVQAQYADMVKDFEISESKYDIT